MMFATSLFVYCVIGALGAFVCLKAWRDGALTRAKVYEPERYYMRGPGPKWREKHASGRISGVQ